MEWIINGLGRSIKISPGSAQSNTNIDFSWVDKMENIVVSQSEMQAFVKQGGLKANGGAS